MNGLHVWILQCYDGLGADLLPVAQRHLVVAPAQPEGERRVTPEDVRRGNGPRLRAPQVGHVRYLVTMVTDANPVPSVGGVPRDVGQVDIGV